LAEISKTTRKISSTASTLLAAMEKSEFLVSLLVCEKLLSTTLPLSVLLQEKSLDLVSAFQHAKEVLSILKNYRNNEDKIFNEIFKLASRLSEKALETDLKIL